MTELTCVRIHAIDCGYDISNCSKKCSGYVPKSSEIGMGTTNVDASGKKATSDKRVESGTGTGA